MIKVLESQNCCYSKSVPDCRFYSADLILWQTFAEFGKDLEPKKTYTYNIYV